MVTIILIIAITVLIYIIACIAEQIKIKKHLYETRIVQLKNGNYVVYQFMKYITGVDTEFNDVSYNHGWKPYGNKDMAEKDPITHKEICYFRNMADAVDLKIRIDNYYKKKLQDEENKRKEKEGYEIANPKVLK